MVTFVVRLHVPDPPRPTGDGGLRGVVDEVATGTSVTFRCGAELLAALGSALAAGTTDPARPEEETA